MALQEGAKASPQFYFTTCQLAGALGRILFAGSLEDFRPAARAWLEQLPVDLVPAQESPTGLGGAAGAGNGPESATDAFWLSDTYFSFPSP